MTFRTLIRRSLCYHWRSHLGVVLGAAVGSAALIGALVVGDSVKGSLRERTQQRLGWIDLWMFTGDRYFSSGLAEIYRAEGLMKARASALLHFPATIVRHDSAGRANVAHVYGVDEDFGPTNSPLTKIPPNHAILNRTLAHQLGVKPGDEIILRVPKPSALSLETPFASKNESSIAKQLMVDSIVGSEEMGELSLTAGQQPSQNVFVRLDELGEMTGLTNKANILALGDCRIYAVFGKFGEWIHGPKWKTWVFIKWLQFKSSMTGEKPLDWEPMSFDEAKAEADISLNDVPSLDYWGFRLVATPQGSGVELRSDRIFLNGALVSAVQNEDVNVWTREFPAPDYTEQVEAILAIRAAVATNHQLILTYLATLLHAGTNGTPYSMVTAAGAPWTPADLRDDEIVVSQWLADDLHVKRGDEIALSYFRPESGAKLEEATNTFRVRSIVPLEMPWEDRTLMPDFPGIENADSTRDWDAGFPLTYKIRQKDEDYWKQHRGTPKAFVTLAAGQKMWGNRFGNLTAIRFPIPTNSDAEEYRATLEKKILANLKPEELGLRFEPVREQALKAAEESQDFGGLFLGFSVFLIAAALLLMAMLFQFGLEQRASEIGTLLALGFTSKHVRKLLLREGVALAFIGGVSGAIGGVYFAKAMLHGLSTVWRDAVGATALQFHVTGQTLLIGLFASVVVSAITLWLALRKFVKREPRELLAGEIGETRSKGQSRKAKAIAIVFFLAGLALAGWAVASGNTANAGAFFGAGALVLVAGLGFASAWLGQLSDKGRAELQVGPKVQQRGPTEQVTIGSLALRGCARRRKRSLGTVAMLACGSFLIISIGVFRLDANRDATQKTSGTGGFALMGESTIPVVHDLNSQSGRDFFALSVADLNGVKVVPFRVREGDEASCLNLNAAQKPKLLGVKPELLEGRFGFQKGAGWSGLKADGGWKMEDGKVGPKGIANSPATSEEIPAIGDANSIQWAMHKNVGDTIDYMDERGQPFKVRIVGAVANSILQGQLIIDETEFVKRFPGESGYGMFLIDAPTNRVTEVSATLSRALQDAGLELTPAPQRLEQFNAVQNTYLGTFQVLGGLGLLLGSVGLGIVVLRNVLERRGELAVLMAVGFHKSRLQGLLLIENGALLALGLGIGVIAAAVAVLPAVLAPSGQLPVGSLTLTLAAVFVNGALWTWVATRFAVRGDLLKALRNE